MCGWSICVLSHLVLDPEETYGLQEVLHWTARVRTFRGRDPESDAHVVAKVMAIGKSDSQGILRRVFLDRADILSRLSHPALPPLREAGITPTGDAFLIFDWSEGVPVSKRLPLDPQEAFPLMVSALEGIECLALHSLVHWNLTPSNILVSPDGSARLVGLGGSLLPMDWWENHRRGAEERERYMAPELLALDGNPAPTIGGAWWRCDLYSLARVACDVVGAVVDGAGTAEPRVHGVPNVDRPALTVLEACLRENPDRRPASIAEVMRALRESTPQERRVPTADPGDDLMSGVSFEEGMEVADVESGDNPFETVMTGAVRLPTKKDGVGGDRAPDKSAESEDDRTQRIDTAAFGALAADLVAKASGTSDSAAADDSPSDVDSQEQAGAPGDVDADLIDKTVAFAVPPGPDRPAEQGAKGARLPFPTLAETSEKTAPEKTIATGVDATRPLPPVPSPGPEDVSDATVITGLPPREPPSRPMPAGKEKGPVKKEPLEKAPEKEAAGPGADGAASDKAATERKEAQRTPSGRYPMAVPDPPPVPSTARAGKDAPPSKGSPSQGAKPSRSAVPKSGGQAGEKSKTPSEVSGRLSGRIPLASDPSSSVPKAAAPAKAAAAAVAPGKKTEADPSLLSQLPKWVIPAAAAGLLLLVVATLALFLMRGKGEEPLPQPEVVREVPPTVIDEPPAAEILAVDDPVRWPAALEEALEKFAAGELDAARDLLADLEDEAEAGELDPRVCDVLNPVREAVLRARATKAQEDLRRATAGGDLALVRAALEQLGPEEDARLRARPGGNDMVEEGQRAVNRVSRVQALIGDSKFDEALAQASRLRGGLAAFERKLGLRERAAKGLERQIDNLSSAGRYEEAESRLTALAEAWPDRAGVTARLKAIQDGKNSSQRWQQLLATASQTVDTNPHEGLAMLRDARPPSRLADSFNDLHARLEASLADLDSGAPTVAVASGGQGRFARGTTLELVLEVEDDYQVAALEVFGRSQIHGDWRTLEVERRDGQYVLRVPPSFHGDRDFEIWAQATDLSGHRGQLASEEEPYEIERKRWWR